VEAKVVCLGRRAEVAHKLLKLLYRQPLVSVNSVKEDLGISHVAAARLLQTLVSCKILTEVTGFKRNRLFQFKSYLNLFSK